MRSVQRNDHHRFLFIFIPFLPAIFAGLIIGWQSTFDIGLLFLIIFLLLGVALGSGWYLWHFHCKELEINDCRWLERENSRIEEVTRYTSELERLLLTISPVLSQHVMISREHTEQEVISLTSRFSNMVNDLQQIVDGTDNAHSRLDSIIETSSDLLQPVLASLKQVHHFGSNIAQMLQVLSENHIDLSQLSLKSAEIIVQFEQFCKEQKDAAAFTPELAILLQDFRQSDQSFKEKIEVVNVNLNSVVTIADRFVDLDHSALSQAENNISQTLSNLTLALAHYRQSIDTLRINAEQLRGEVNNVLVALQFQDRVSQILIQVENNLLNLKGTIERIQEQGSDRDSKMLQVDAALEHIEENYRSVSSPTNKVSDSVDDLTFF